MTNKELFDLKTMLYFMPDNRYQTKITEADKQAMVDYSSRGVKPERTLGLLNIMAGKTYRELQIATWIEDIKNGITTLEEVLSEEPEWIKGYLLKSLGGGLYNDTPKISRRY